MAMTNAEKQAAHRAKNAERTTFLEAANATLVEENTALKEQLAKAKTKILGLQKKLKALTPEGMK